MNTFAHGPTLRLPREISKSRESVIGNDLIELSDQALVGSENNGTDRPLVSGASRGWYRRGSGKLAKTHAQS